jgi:hypothetical protein
MFFEKSDYIKNTSYPIMEKKSKKDYQSTKEYSKKYNKENINIQINRSLIFKLRKQIGVETVKSYIENLIKEKIDND